MENMKEEMVSQEANVPPITRAVSARNLPVNHPRTRRQHGATVEQFMLWALLAALVALAAIIGYARGAAGQTGQDFVSEFNEMGANASNVYNGQWDQFSTANAEKSGIFDNFMTVKDNKNGTISIKGGGTISVAPGQVQTANDAGEFTVDAVSAEFCKKVIVGAAGSAVTMTLNDTVVKTQGGLLDPTAQCNTTNNKIVVTRQ